MIKICGIGTMADAEAAALAGADMIGLVRAPGSPRELELASAKKIAAKAPEGLQTVGVYVDPSHQDVEDLPSDWIQLHGEETAEEVTAISRLSGRKVIRGFHFQPQACQLWDAHPHVAALLLDGPSAGSGESFDHGILAEVMGTLKKPIILAGGLDPENVAESIRLMRPWGVDVSSGVESKPGTKDHGRIAAFCQAVRNAEQL